MKKIKTFLLFLSIFISISVQAKSFRGDDFAPFPLRATQLKLIKGVWQGDSEQINIHDLSYSSDGRPLMFITVLDKYNSQNKTQGIIYYSQEKEEYIFYDFEGGAEIVGRVKFYKTKPLWYKPNSNKNGCRSVKVLMEVAGVSFWKQQCY